MVFGMRDAVEKETRDMAAHEPILMSSYIVRLIEAYSDHPAAAAQTISDLRCALDAQLAMELWLLRDGYDSATGIKLDLKTGKPVAAPRRGPTAIDILAELDQL